MEEPRAAFRCSSAGAREDGRKGSGVAIPHRAADRGIPPRSPADGRRWPNHERVGCPCGARRSRTLLSTETHRLLDSGLIADPESARGRILLASSRLFGSKGFSATTVRDIAAEVGILSGSIFHHFHNKEEILFEVMSGIVRLALARLERDLGAAGTLEEELRALIHCELQSVHDRSGAGFQVLGREWRHLTPESQARILELRDRYNAVWLDRVERAREQCLHAADSRLLRHFLRGAIVDTHTWFEPRGRVSLEEIEGELYRTFFAAGRDGRSSERRPCSP